MAQLNMVINHNLERSEALKRIKGLLKELKSQHTGDVSNIKQSWKQGVGFFSFTVKNILLKGVIVVGEDSVIITSDLPWQAALFKGRIEAQILKQVRKILK